MRTRTPILDRSTSAPADVDRGQAPPRTVDDVASAVPRIRVGRIVFTVIALLFAAQFAYFLVGNPKFGWDIVGDYLFNPLVMDGLKMTLLLTAISMVLGTIIGIAVAAARTSDYRVARMLAWGYTRFFFGVPLLVQLIFWFNLAYLVPKLSIGIPFGPHWGSWSANDLIKPVVAAILGLALHEGAYMSEVVRAGILSVDKGQRDASRSLDYKVSRHFA